MMNAIDIQSALRFYFITDDQVDGFPAPDQVHLAVTAGATMVQYRNKNFSLDSYQEVETICHYCREREIPFIVNDNVLLAKAVGADGVHVGQEDTSAKLVRCVMGPKAIVGISVSNMAELKQTDLSVCDYIGTGPIFPTGTKADAKAVQGLGGLKEIAGSSALPAVAIGGIDAEKAPACYAHGAAGVAVISCITRAKDPGHAALSMAKACTFLAQKGQ